MSTALPSPDLAPLPPAADRPAPSRGTESEFEAGLRQLPAYMRSLLQIQVPLVVTLAAKQESVSSILQIGLGTILQFEKHCDEVLEVEVAGCRVAEGEPVKVGDKFGLRVTSIALPEERFQAIGAGRTNATAPASSSAPAGR